jgi:DNA-binding winged helix-turn-helix (wHTH) protein
MALTLEEIGEKLNLTKERIRQIRNRAILKLKHPSRAHYLQGYLSLFFPDVTFMSCEKGNQIYFGLETRKNETKSINLIKKYIVKRSRKTSYPDIPNISETCRKLIVNFLKEQGEPCSYNDIKQMVWGKYPLLTENVIIYALSTAEKITNIHKGFYALSEWVNNKPPKKEGTNEKSNKQKLTLNKSVAKVIAVSQKQYKLINFILKNNGNISKLKLMVFSRVNHIDVNQIINSINDKFYNNFNEPLITEHESNFQINDKFIS